MKALAAAALVLLTACASVALDQPRYESAVRVVAGHGWGSGVVVAVDRVLTAAHVANRGDLTVETARGAVIPVDGIIEQGAPGTLSDYALLDVVTGAPVSAVYCGPLRLGQRLVHVGYPAVEDQSVRQMYFGRVSALDVGEHMLFSHVVGVDMMMNSGSSGGPVYDEQGRVVGIFGGMARYGTGGLGLMVRPPEALCEA